MPINSASIPALRVARAVRRKKRAEGGGIFDWSSVGSGNPDTTNSPVELPDPLLAAGKSVVWDMPKRMIDSAKENPGPGLRREDYTDIPADDRFGGGHPVDPMIGASLESSVNLAGMHAPFVQPGTAGIFGGKLAQTADHAKLARAEEMTAAGAAPEQIWQDTGWFKGPDDQWRFEINDAASGYKRQIGRGTIDNYPISNSHTTEAGAAYQHPDLYAAYPDLEKMPLNFRPMEGGYNGEYSHNPASPGDLIPPHEAIAINTPRDRYGDNMQKARSTTLHEMQHAVQTREGFVPGGNPGEMRELVQATTDARLLQNQIHAGFSPEEVTAAFTQEFGRPPHPAAGKIAQELTPDDLARIATDPHEAYRRLHGEVEARNVQTRRDFTPEQRATTFPGATEDIPADLQTLGRGRRGRSASEVIDEQRPAAAAPAGPAAAADPGAVGSRGGGPSGVRSLPEAQAAAARWAGERAPLEGIPGPLKIGEDYFVPGPIGKIHDVAESYMATHRPEIAYTPPSKYHPIDPEHSAAIGKAYEEMPHTPNDPATKASYDALIDETAKQYDAIKQTGLKIEPIPAGAPDPYAANPRLAARDVAENNHLWFFPTEGGFGTVNKITDNPMLRKTGEKIGDHELLANDMFRVVHDYFGHLKQGHGFRAAGEDNAWRGHSAMYSDLARPAMTSETRGQNSWVNYGPHGEKNRSASGADTVYADQKVGLMPPWTMYDKGQAPLEVFHGSPHPGFDKFNSRKIGTGEGQQVYGDGLYMAGHEPVSERYRQVLSVTHDPLLKKYKLDDVSHVIANHFADAGGDPMKLAHEYRLLRDNLISSQATDKATKSAIKDYDRRIAYLTDPERNKGSMYRVAFEANPEHLLDYDNALRSQTPYVQERVGPPMEASAKHQLETIKGVLKNNTMGTPGGRFSRTLAPGKRAELEGRLELLEQTGAASFKGSDIYKRLGLPAKSENEAFAQSTQRLRGMKIPGMRYLDAGSRIGGAGEVAPKTTHNYVVFDDSMLKILRRYGIAGIPAAGVLAAGEGEQHYAKGGRVARRLAHRLRKAAGGGAYGVFSPAEQAELDPPYAAPAAEEDTSPVLFGTASPLVNITERDIDRGIGVGLGAATVGGPARGVVGRIADDTGASMARAARPEPGLMPQLAERYPEVAPPVTKIDKKTGREYMGKDLSDEAMELQQHRLAMKPDIEAGRYEPYFDPAKRTDVDPAGYPAHGDTGQILMKKPVTRDQYDLMAGNPEAVARLDEAYARGLQQKDAAGNWYFMKQLEDEFIKEYGKKQGRALFKERFADSMAATTGGADPTANLLMAHYGNYLKAKGQAVPAGNQMPYPIGGQYAANNMAQFRKMIMEGQGIDVGNPKRHNFSGNFLGQKARATIDEQMSKLFKPGMQMPPTGAYGHFENVLAARAAHHGVDPRYFQEVAWAGAKDATEKGGYRAKPMIGHVNDTVERTHRVTGMPRSEVVRRGLVRAEIPLYGGAAAAALPALSGGDEPQYSKGGSVNAALKVARRIKRAKGGAVHLGPIVGKTDGRADKVPMQVPDGSYVLTADHCSAMGEGNTLAGFEKLKKMFPKSVAAYKAAKATPVQRASGGRVPILAADGEFVICPDDIKDRFGDLDKGHRVLDHWQTTERKNHIQTLAKLAPPAQD